MTQVSTTGLEVKEAQTIMPEDISLESEKSISPVTEQENPVNQDDIDGFSDPDTIADILF